MIAVLLDKAQGSVLFLSGLVYDPLESLERLEGQY
jgi:hypothetical protein